MLKEKIGQKIITEDIAQNESLLLSNNWSFREKGSEKWLKATIPGTNFTDLLANELIPEPFSGSNEDQLQWVESCDWEYQCVFDVDEKILSNANIEIVFEGLDTYCRVYLNGELIILSDNMFIDYRSSIKKHLVLGKNELLLHFESAVNGVEERFGPGLIYPAENDKSEKKHSAYVRKAPYHFGWDWGPRFVASGVWRGVRLETAHHAKINTVKSRQQWIDHQNVRVHFSLEIEGFKNLPATISIASDKLPDSYNRCVDINEGNNTFDFQMDITNPGKWWPNGLGIPNLYSFSFDLIVFDQNISSKELKVGFRKIEVINKPDDDGESFYFEINDVPVFMKGANYIPSDSFLPQVSDEKYKKVFEDAVASNFNMLRVWGGGIYEDDLFYDLADEYGILIWQDFMFACTLYPSIDVFKGSVEQEVIYNINRLGNHPCIALWCGNNEIEMGIETWEWPEKFNYDPETYESLKEDYNELFKRVIPGLVKKHDPDRFYFSSSPIGFWEREEEDRKGDNHYWGVWHGEEDFMQYAKRIPRFMSEYGFQSFPIFSSVKKFVPHEEMHLDSSTFQTHQKHPRGNRIISETIEKYFNKPKDFESFLYLSQLVQAEGVKVAMEAHRANNPFCMGTLYWQLNDCWPSISWSSIDYYGKWKALQYQARRSFATVSILGVESEDSWTTYLVNDCLEAKQGELSIKYYATDEILMEDNLAVGVDSNSSKVVFKLDKSKVPNNAIALHYELTIDHKKVEERTLFLSRAIDLELPKPKFGHHITRKGNDLEVAITSETLIKNLFIEFKGSQGNFSDNFFDMLPGMNTTIHYRLSEGEELKELRFFSVYDTYNH